MNKETIIKELEESERELEKCYEKLNKN